MHHFQSAIEGIEWPRQFTYPFCYTPHPLCQLAAKQVQAYLSQQAEWQEELSHGKMFGVLVVHDAHRQIGFLAAYSGILAQRNDHPYFVPPVFDLLRPDGFFKKEEEHISAINRQIACLEQEETYLQLKADTLQLSQDIQQELEEAKARMKAAKAKRDSRRQEALLQPDKAISPAEEAEMIRESQFLKAAYKRLERERQAQLRLQQQALQAHEANLASLKTERKVRSAQLQHQLFAHFRLLNQQGEVRDLCDIFQSTIHQTPPAGAGECAAPKLLQYAYLHHLHPLAMAEFWWGASPKTEVRHHGHYYPACKGKCEPILRHMLRGLDVEQSPLEQYTSQSADDIETVYEDPWLMVVNKPAGMLSVPGKGSQPSVQSLLQSHATSPDGLLTVHRLDMDTSGLLILAKTRSVQQLLQRQFEERQVKKRYVALLDGRVEQAQGTIALPLCPNPMDRPRQMVHPRLGKQAITRYEVIAYHGEETRIAFYPETGRTHQLRVHAAHPSGLHCPIVGDRLYGKEEGSRLCLHAEQIAFTHPILKTSLCFTSEVPF